MIASLSASLYLTVRLTPWQIWTRRATVYLLLIQTLPDSSEDKRSVAS
jgi:hypothetical protein